MSALTSISPSGASQEVRAALLLAAFATLSDEQGVGTRPQSRGVGVQSRDLNRKGGWP